MSAALPRDLLPEAARTAEQHRSADELYEEQIASLPLTEYSLAEVLEKLGAKASETKRVTAALTSGDPCSGLRGSSAAFEQVAGRQCTRHSLAYSCLRRRKRSGWICRELGPGRKRTRLSLPT